MIRGLALQLPLARGSHLEDKMKNTFLYTTMILVIAEGSLWAGQTPGPAATGQGDAGIINKAQESTVLVITGNGSGKVEGVTVGAIVRQDGIVLTAYRPLKGAEEVQVRLRDGEVYDQVEMIGFDERRDVAALHFTASGLSFLPGGTLEQASPGDKIHVLNVEGPTAWSIADGVLGPVRLADEILEAGHGYRVIQFMAELRPGARGGALIDSRGQLLGIITGSPNSVAGQFAVPVESVGGLAAQGLRVAFGVGRNLVLPATIPSQTRLSEDQPSSKCALATARSVRVMSKTTFLISFLLEQELMNNRGFRNLGINVLDGDRASDLLMVVDRPVFTYDFTYSLSDGRSGSVIGTGKVTAIDGAHAAPGIAKLFVQDVEQARTRQEAQPN